LSSASAVTPTYLGEGKTVGDFRLVFEMKRTAILLHRRKQLMDDSYVYKKRLTGKVFEPECSDFDGDALLAVGLKSKSVRLRIRQTAADTNLTFRASERSSSGRAEEELAVCLS
jgi:hypothetical protein